MLRLQRFLAQCGVASRRRAEQVIVAGRVSVNGKVVREPGNRVDPTKDRICVDGQRIVPEDHVWLLLHKPPCTICSTHDPEGRQTVLDLVNVHGNRIYPVGRLDYHTSGVLLLTNDGALAQRLMHPSQQIPREYHVKVAGQPSIVELDRLREGVTIDNGQRVAAEVALLYSTGKHTWLQMTLRQGINRQIHRMMDAIGRRVLKLIRVEFAGIRADELPLGHCRELTQKEIDELRAACGLPKETRRSHPSRGFRTRPTRSLRARGAPRPTAAKRTKRPTRRKKTPAG